MKATTVFDRALELAQTGRYPDVFSIRRRLVAEGYPSGELFGLSRRRLLAEAIREARGQLEPTFQAR